MEAKYTSLGRSIDVPSVQELAKEPLATIPNRYVRCNQEPVVMDWSSLSSEIPVINLQNLLSGDSTTIELQKFHRACKEWGFFQLTDHGVSSTLMNKVKLEIENLFNLPMEEKKKYRNEPGDLQGFGQLFVISDEQKLNWADLFLMVISPTHMQKHELFSKLPSSFRVMQALRCRKWVTDSSVRNKGRVAYIRPYKAGAFSTGEAMISYSTEAKSVVIKLLEQMEKALKLNKSDGFSALFEGGYQAMRMNYYPPCQQPDVVMGLNPHSDAGGLTILLQLNQVEGLQIKKEGMWVPVKPLPNAFIVNIGDILEIMTNGIYKSIEHRVVVNSEKERLSIATFHSPNMDAIFGPAPSLVTRETPPLFQKIGVADYYRKFFSHKLQEKSNLNYWRVRSEEQGVN